MTTKNVPRVPLSQWVNELPQEQQNRLLEKIKAVQLWITDFAQTLGKRRAPRARITDSVLYYAPWSNVIAVPVTMLLEADDRLLRIAIAHECGHFNRRWLSLFSRTDFARLCEEIQADRVAMVLTGASLDDLDAVIRHLADYETSWPSGALEAYIAKRRTLLEAAAVQAN